MTDRASQCVSCGEWLVPNKDLSDMPYEIQDAMKVRCRDCACEVLGLTVPKIGSLQHDTGGGWRVIKETNTL